MSDKSERWMTARVEYWSRVLPIDVALEQAKWERRTMIARGMAAKVKLVQMGKILGLHPQIVKHAYDQGLPSSRHWGRREQRFSSSPIERYFQQQLDLRKLAAVRAVGVCPTCGRPLS